MTRTLSRIGLSIDRICLPQMCLRRPRLVSSGEAFLEIERARLMKNPPRTASASSATAPSSSNASKPSEPTSTAPESSSSTSNSSAPAPTAQRHVNKTISDFLSSIEEEQKQQGGGMGAGFAG